MASADVRTGAEPVPRRGVTMHPRLRALNAIVGLVHAAQGVFMLVLSNDLSLPVTVSFLTDDPVAVQGPATPEVAFRLGIGATVAAFLFLAAADHLLLASPGIHRWYERRLERRANEARWIEYTVSASIMIVLIVMFTGVRDLAALMAIFAVNSAMILFGLMMERGEEPGTADWSAFWFGSAVGLVPWVIVAIHVAGAPQVPGFVYAITVTQFALFFSFALNMALQYLRVGRWRSYVFGEGAYIVLSLTAKTLLAWLIFANVLRT